MKIKSNTPYPILLIEAGLSTIESLAMIRFLLYKHKLNNIDDHRLPKLALNSNQNHLRLNQGWHKDTRPGSTIGRSMRMMHCKKLITLKILLLLSSKK